jgi:integrase
VWSQRTYNHRVTKLKAFGNWLVKRKHAKFNPFVGLETANAEADRKHVRRALEHVELLRLIAATRASVKVLNGMTGDDRAALYLTAAYTGFRARGLASLSLRSIEYRDGIPAAFNLTARASKNGKPHTVPLHPDVGRELARWLASRTPREKLWPGDGWSKHGAKMLRSDLSEARAAYLAEAKDDAAELARRQASDVLLYRDAAGEVFDFHSLRVQFISGLARSGVPLMAAAKLADHSDPRLTAGTYAKWGRELDGEVAKLPGLGSLTVG